MTNCNPTRLLQKTRLLQLQLLHLNRNKMETELLFNGASIYLFVLEVITVKRTILQLNLK